MGKSLIRNGLELMQTWNPCSSSSWKKVNIEMLVQRVTFALLWLVNANDPVFQGDVVVLKCGYMAGLHLSGFLVAVQTSYWFVATQSCSILHHAAGQDFCPSHLNHNEIQQRAKKCTLTNMQYGSMSRLMVSLCQIWSKSQFFPWPGLMECHCNFRKKSGTWESESSKSQKNSSRLSPAPSGQYPWLSTYI